MVTFHRQTQENPMPTTALRPLLWTLAAALSAPSAFASTQTFRCKNDLVSVGDSKASVLQKCGEPVVKDSFCKPVEAATTTSGSPKNATVVSVNACQPVDDWTYNPGRGQFMTSLKFESGKLTSITYGERVK